MRRYMDGTTSSSLYEARLGHKKFGKETHAYSVVWKDEEIDEVKKYASKIIFNSTNQLKCHYSKVSGMNLGLRINPGVSYSHFDLANPTRKRSRLGVKDDADIKAVASKIRGVMFHNQCENDDFEAFAKIVDTIGRKYAWLLKDLEWVTLGGGIWFTKEGYPLDRFCDKLKQFSQKHDVQVYLEPGEAAVHNAGFLITSVLDIVQSSGAIAVLDAAANVHMPDLVTYREPAKMELPENGTYEYELTGRSCLAGDVFGTFKFAKRLKVGSIVPIGNAASYTMVQKSWFNGVPMPSIVIRRLDGSADMVQKFDYEDYAKSLS